MLVRLSAAGRGLRGKMTSVSATVNRLIGDLAVARAHLLPHTSGVMLFSQQRSSDRSKNGCCIAATLFSPQNAAAEQRYRFATCTFGHSFQAARVSSGDAGLPFATHYRIDR